MHVLCPHSSFLGWKLDCLLCKQISRKVLCTLESRRPRNQASLSTAHGSQDILSCCELKSVVLWISVISSHSALWVFPGQVLPCAGIHLLQRRSPVPLAVRGHAEERNWEGSMWGIGRVMGPLKEAPRGGKTPQHYRQWEQSPPASEGIGRDVRHSGSLVRADLGKASDAAQSLAWLKGGRQNPPPPRFLHTLFSCLGSLLGTQFSSLEAKGQKGPVGSWPKAKSRANRGAQTWVHTESPRSWGVCDSYTRSSQEDVPPSQQHLGPCAQDLVLCSITTALFCLSISSTLNIFVFIELMCLFFLVLHDCAIFRPGVFSFFFIPIYF